MPGCDYPVFHSADLFLEGEGKREMRQTVGNLPVRWGNSENRDTERKKDEYVTDLKQNVTRRHGQENRVELSSNGCIAFWVLYIM